MPLCGWYLRFPGVSACYLQLYCPHVLYAYSVPPLKNLQDHFLSPNRSLWTLGLNPPHVAYLATIQDPVQTVQKISE